MARDKKNGKPGKKGGKSTMDEGQNGHAGDHVIEFTPEGGFNIRTAARNFANLMRESLQPLIIHLPHVSVEFEPGCTPQEIIDGYNLAMQTRYGVEPSNANTK